MQAVRLHSPNSEPVIVEIPAPVPGPGEVLPRVDAAGLCHSDLHLMEWPEHVIPYKLPFTLGHETAGTVVALGPGAGGVSEGDRVVAHARWGCGRCWACLQGMENGCEQTIGELDAHGAGVGRDGGLAEYMLVPSARYLVAIGELDAAVAAPLSDAALTPYHAIKRVAAQLRPGATVVVIGVGGIGRMAVQLLRALTKTRVVAVDVRDDALELALAPELRLRSPPRTSRHPGCAPRSEAPARRWCSTASPPMPPWTWRQASSPSGGQSPTSDALAARSR